MRNDKETILHITGYFYEVLIRHYLSLEKEFDKQSGLFNIFKRIDYSYRSLAFQHLFDLFKESNEALPMLLSDTNSSDLAKLHQELKICFSLFDALLKSQIDMNNSLNLKANGLEFGFNDFRQTQQLLAIQRKKLEQELPKLLACYRTTMQEDMSI